MDSETPRVREAGTAPADAQLLSELQDRFPIAEQPFRVLAERLGGSEADVLARVMALRDAGILRHVTPIFDPAAMGYRSCLVAMRVPEDRLDAAVAVINAHPGVSHNYRREHAFNLWFTIATPPGSDLQGHVARLHQLAGASSTHELASVRLFKIGVSLDVSGERALTHREAAGPRRPRQARGPVTAPTQQEIDVIRAVQGDLPLEQRPFRDAAEQLGITERALVSELERLHAEGRLRRIAGVLRHRAAGFSANGMAVWDVADDRVAEVGESMATYSAISHCYQRPRYDDWPYNLFTMIHARSKDECGAFVRQLAQAHDVGRYDVLYSSIEYKKIRPRYFTPDVGRWERENGLAYEAAG